MALHQVIQERQMLARFSGSAKRNASRPVLKLPGSVPGSGQGLPEKTAAEQEILRNDLKPIDNRLLIEDVLVLMLDAQANAHTILRVSVETIRQHGGFPLNVRFQKEPWASGHSASPRAVSTYLQLFAGFTLATGLGAAATLAGARVLALVGSTTALTLTGVLSSTTVLLHLGCVRLCVIPRFGRCGGRKRRPYYEPCQCSAHQSFSKCLGHR